MKNKGNTAGSTIISNLCPNSKLVSVFNEKVLFFLIFHENTGYDTH